MFLAVDSSTTVFLSTILTTSFPGTIGPSFTVSSITVLTTTFFSTNDQASPAVSDPSAPGNSTSNLGEGNLILLYVADQL